MIKIPLILCLVTLLSSALLMLSEEVTYEKIEEQKQWVLLNSLKQLIPDELHDNNLIESTISLNEPDALGLREVQSAYIGRLNGKLSVVAIPVTSRTGYSGDIDLMVGIKSNGEITAVKILEQHETPGLGDLIEERKGDWLKQFPDKSLNNLSEQQWKVKRDGGDFDQITGATITPRAVVAAIYQALKFFEANKQKLESASVSGENNE
ncbi:MAG: electron transport complex subunit RsxG [Marinicellaceae bacterium]